MKLKTEQSEIISSSNNKEDFKIKTSAKSFQILSNNLYSDKIKAVCREYLCNAIDAHRLNGNTNPFKVTFPYADGLEENLLWSVRDFGPGLSEEDIQRLFCTYFSSSKDESNEFTGALGLGCKSGFAYSTSFYVTSWNNGTESKYIMNSENGIPSCFKLYAKESTDPSGLCVEIPVEETDIVEFKNCTYQVLAVFPENLIQKDLLEIINSFTSITPLEGSSGMIMDCYKIKPDLYALMGNVLYPIDFQKIESELRHKLHLHLCNKIFAYKSSLVVNFDIGELDIAPSREQLSYDPETIKALNDKIEGLISWYMSKTFESEEFKKAKLLDSLSCYDKDLPECIIPDFSSELKYRGSLETLLLEASTNWFSQLTEQDKAKYQHVATVRYVNYSSNWGNTYTVKFDSNTVVYTVLSIVNKVISGGYEKAAFIVNDFGKDTGIKHLEDSRISKSTLIVSIRTSQIGEYVELLSKLTDSRIYMSIKDFCSDNKIKVVKNATPSFRPTTIFTSVLKRTPNSESRVDISLPALKEELSSGKCKLINTYCSESKIRYLREKFPDHTFYSLPEDVLSRYKSFNGYIIDSYAYRKLVSETLDSITKYSNYNKVAVRFICLGRVIEPGRYMYNRISNLKIKSSEFSIKEIKDIDLVCCFNGEVRPDFNQMVWVDNVRAVFEYIENCLTTDPALEDIKEVISLQKYKTNEYPILSALMLSKKLTIKYLLKILIETFYKEN